MRSTAGRGCRRSITRLVRAAALNRPAHRAHEPPVRAPGTRGRPVARRAELLRHASALHDIGKIGVPDRVLLKPGKLDAEEWEIMKTHAELGASLLADSPTELLQLAEVVARTHHERWDGAGYPAGLAGEEIPLVGRISTICDVFDALTSARPYKEAWPVEDALMEIAAQRARQFDPELVDAFLGLWPDDVRPAAEAEPAVAAR